MGSQPLLRLGFLGLIGLLCLLLVHQTLHVTDSSPSRNHARDLVASATPRVWQGQNLTISVSSSRGLAARALDFETAVQKGNGLYCKCRAKWQLSDESAWTTIDELENYWESHAYGENAGTEPDSVAWLKEALTAKGLPTVLSSNNGKDGNLVGQFWVQEKPWTTEVNANGKETDGFYINPMSPIAGLVIAENNRSPADMSGGRTCPISKWSDVVWLSYAALARSTGSSVANLKYLVRTHIINADTLSVMKTVCGGPCPAWPGMVFDINQKKSGGVLINQNGLALLGTPNGGGAAWLLINHKQQLGKKTPISVTAWTTSGLDENGNDEPWFHMIFQFSS
ncbi:uncharacterized protein N7482_001534 [Penicillium canariense]|uniref:Uncharacterized protein n=1 Tax=Penicillium canariense TaxID=189055 RepID=A0A9W9IFT2_9EURO|nr:uncharacterized protein N7482_001534 [Penicillium canariense]KAJ5175657.1 hypothetical protein N7482_001534 [Penicillium canariense]